MICEPSLLPMLSNPILDTRQEFQPSMNFRDPASISTVVSGSLMPFKQGTGQGVLLHNDAGVVGLD